MGPTSVGWLDFFEECLNFFEACSVADLGKLQISVFVPYCAQFCSLGMRVP
ncbi:UNVERIFIED_CONTAM: hypothetical protein DES50_101214 [Williamsia faeni]